MPNICKICLKTFSTAEKLDIHLYRQECQKPGLICKYNCDLCGQDYAKKSDLISHQKNTNSFCARINQIKQNPIILNNPIFNSPIYKNKKVIKNTIKFNKRGKENIDHITKDVVLELFKNQKFIFICEELMKLIYFNEKVPQNSSWSIAYPKNETAGVDYNHDEDEFERKPTKEIVEDKFSNMINLLVPVMQSIHKDAEFYETLSDVQQINMVTFFYHLGMYQISKESPEVYEAMHRLCYEQRKIPMKLWGDQGYKGNHLSLKFG